MRWEAEVIQCKWNRIFLFLLAAAAGFFAGCRPSYRPAAKPLLLPGVTDSGQVLLPNQWSLHPAGRQVFAGDFPLNTVFSPDGDFLAVTHGGYGPNEIVIFRFPSIRPETEFEEAPDETAEIVSRVELPNLWYGLAFSPDGTKLYAGGGRDDKIYRFDFKDGFLFNRTDIDLYEEGRELLPAGLCISSDGASLYTACGRDDSIGVIEIGGGVPAVRFFPLPEGSFPYTCLLAPDQSTLYVSLWGQARVAEIDLAALRLVRTIPTDDHPNEMVITGDGKRLFVSNANRNSVSIIDTEQGKVVEAVSSALYPGAPEGSTPNSLALSKDERFLLIANADNNNLALFELEPGRSCRSRGFIPVGWYPTSVRIRPKSRTIIVANGKGMSSKSNRHGPVPGRDPILTREYIAGLFTGTLSLIDWPDDIRIHEYTRQAYACTPLREDKGVTAVPEGPNPIPRKVGDPSPIKHCVYIVKENRTYDQIFGDIEKGNGDPSLCLFPEKVTPNHHALAESFVLLDNFYVESEVSADGHEWSMGAYATDFVEKTWPSQYGHRARISLGYVGEGSYDIAAPSAGYIWDRCAQAGLSYHSYGEFVDNGKTAGDPGTAAVESLEGHFDPWFRSFDMRYSDLDRADRFIEELERFEREGEMPRFTIIRLPNDHTSGSSPGYLTPTAYLAQNDLALGRVIEALSRSSFWREMAIFVVEDDAQNGPDHVDAHRTVALAVSPYIRRGGVDSGFYSTASMLRTMELILGLEPMSQFDAAARPMYAAFTMKPDFTPYKCRPAGVSLEETNAEDAWGADLSMSMNLEVEDAADDILLNRIIWKNVRGPDSEMPAPVRAAFVFPLDEKEEDDGGH
jgi:YVTN family beta-propeller protein